MADVLFLDRENHATSSSSAQLLQDACVLVVDDMPDELRLIARILTDAGARVLVSVHGIEAMRLIQQMHPDIVLLDVCMPPPTGIQVCSALYHNAELKHIPVLFLSGNDEIPTKLDAFDSGARDFIVKPFNAVELVARVALHIKLARMMHDGKVGNNMPVWFKKCIQYLQTSVHLPLEISTVAREFGTTVYGLQQAFRLYLNTTPAVFLREARLNESARHIRDTPEPIAEIGKRFGYDNPANFSTAFKEHFGVSPIHYRKNAPRAHSSG